MRGVTQPLSTTVSCYTLPGFIHQARKSRVSLWPNESDSGGSSWLIKRQSGWAKSDDDSGLVFGYGDFSTVEQEKINVYSRNSYVKNGSTKYYLYPFVILSPRLKSYGKQQMDRGEYIYIYLYLVWNCNDLLSFGETFKRKEDGRYKSRATNCKEEKFGSMIGRSR